MTGIQEKLFALQDTKYREFQSKLMPTVDPDTVIGVRTPQLRKLAKEIAKTEEKQLLLQGLPHAYFEENQLHAFVIALEKDFERCLAEVERFLPYIDNWATCDQLLRRYSQSTGRNCFHVLMYGWNLIMFTPSVWDRNAYAAFPE